MEASRSPRVHRVCLDSQTRPAHWQERITAAPPAEVHTATIPNANHRDHERIGGDSIEAVKARKSSCANITAPIAALRQTDQEHQGADAVDATGRGRQQPGERPPKRPCQSEANEWTASSAIPVSSKRRRA